MKQEFSMSWKSSKKREKQRKYRANAPLHIKRKFVSAHLSKELRQKLKRRSLILRKGDKVKILRGKFRGKPGKIERINAINEKVYVAGVEITKKDGSKALLPINPAKLLITDAIMDDPKRKKIIRRKTEIK